MENKIEKASDRISTIKKKRKLPETFPSIFAVVFLLLSSTFCWFTHLKLKLTLKSKNIAFSVAIPQQNSIFLSSSLIFHVFYSSNLWVSSHHPSLDSYSLLARLMILCSWALALKIQERILVIISTQLSPMQDLARLETMMAFEEKDWTEVHAQRETLSHFALRTEVNGSKHNCIQIGLHHQMSSPHSPSFSRSLWAPRREEWSVCIEKKKPFL